MRKKNQVVREIRNLTFRLYPTPRQEKVLLDAKGIHQRLYNTCLEQRIGIQKNRKTFEVPAKWFSKSETAVKTTASQISYNAQSKQLTEALKEDRDFIKLTGGRTLSRT